ncbi:PAS domain S-box protein [Candidatus Poribacteria bacterium]|nr:PAS domain S-box protein [Candidatus Poribacteria bacterium]
MTQHGASLTNNHGTASTDTLVSEGRYEKLYRMLMDATPSSVLLLDQGLRVVVANHNFLEKAQRSEHDTIGRRLNEVFPIVILREMELEQWIQQVFQKGEPVRGKRMRYRAPGVADRIYYYSLIPVTWHRKTENVMLLMDDVTEQVRLGEEVLQAERHLASIVESASDIIVSTDTEGRIMTWNKAAQEATDYCLQEVAHHPFFDFFASDCKTAVKGALENPESPGRSAYTEWNLKTKRGHEIPVSWVCSRMRDGRGKVQGIVAVGRDLTERRKLETQVLQSQKLAALGVMAGGIAHEIRGPLAIASSAAQFLMEDEVSPSLLIECTQRIHRGIQRASTIIEDLLRFSRPSIPKKPTERVDLALVVKDTIALVHSQAQIEKVNVTVKAPAAPVIVTGVASMLQQMVMNILLNAFNALSDDGGRVDVIVSDEGEFAVLKVTDNGCGIPQSEINKIFDPFYTTSPPGKGTGLGLSLCYSIVRHHNGTIQVESTEGAGTSLIVRLSLS